METSSSISSSSTPTEEETPSSAKRKTNLSAGLSDPLAATSSSISSKNVLVVEETMFQTLAGVIGNVLEWYDFALFGYFSDIIAIVFFPPAEPGDDNNEYDNLLKSFVIFGGAFLMRPIGGLIIGYIGDKHGRKKALTRSLFLMAIPTTLMGCLPTYETAGTISIVLLVLCRLVQGLSVGGQLPASLVYTVEKRHPSEWGLYGTLPVVMAEVGALLGNLTGAFMRQILTEQQLIDWGWRIPFLSGILIGFVAYYIRQYGAEVHVNAGVYDHQDSIVTNPISVAFSTKENRVALLATTLVPTLYACGFYVTYVWLAIFMDDLLDPPIPHAFWVNAVSMLLGLTLVLPLCGALSDRLKSRIKMMTIGALSIAVTGPFLIIAIATSNGNSWLAFLCQTCLGLQLAIHAGPLLAWMIENFNPEVRLTSASLGYDLAHAIVAGFSPAIATSLFINFGPTAPGLIYTAFGLVSVIGIYINYFCGSAGKYVVDKTTAEQDENLDLLQTSQMRMDKNLREIS